MDNAKNRYVMASGYGTGWGRSPHQSILVSLADSHLWEKALFINRIFSKPLCHTEKHTFNKMPFLTSLLFPPLPCGRGEGSIYNVDFYWELQLSPFLSRNREMSLRGVCDKLQRGLFWRVGGFSRIAISCQRRLYLQGGCKTNVHATGGIPTFPWEFFVWSSWIQRWKGPDPCSDELGICDAWQTVS